MAQAALVDEHELIPPGSKVVHPPYGFVRLVAYDADDLAVVNAARVSFNKESEWDESDVEDFGDDEKIIMGRKLGESDEKVLRFLLRNKHGTPFEHTYFKFHIRAPIFVFREWHRHRIGISINEESARYVPLQPHFYVPDDEHMRTQTDKPGRYKFAPIEDVNKADAMRERMKKTYIESYATYELMMDMGLAKEVARAVLPVAIYSQMMWTCNARSLMNFLALRNADTALREIRDYAQAMEVVFADLMPVTHDEFVANDRTAP